MTGLGDTTRGGNSRGHIARPAQAQEEQPSSRKELPIEGWLVAVGGRSGRLFWETGLGKKG